MQAAMVCAGFHYELSKWSSILCFVAGISGCASDRIREQMRQGHYVEAVQLCLEGPAGANRRACEETRLRAIEADLANLDRLRLDARTISHQLPDPSSAEYPSG